MIEHLKDNYGYLFEDALLQEINQVGVFKEIPEGNKLIEIGDYIKSMPLLISGAVKILREDDQGDELVLYFIERGDTCAMTLSCCMGQKKSEIRAIAETDTTLIMIPVEHMSLWMGKYKSWQNFILQSYHERMSELLEAIDTIAFLKMDERILKYLRDKAMVNHSEEISATHQQIANDLHTSRVVVSRILKALENNHQIKINRNRITLLDL
ncbi:MULTISPECIES: Crp/Fnr family transcriptional regulator [Xanthomarina]|jgi:CRP/FNR family transcriptional regulator|uniref:Crp/Fnr family transcriptional regulator n=2 Tax=Xanthomarina gelatinilytica TaxID=1137281 RepID=M7MG12_9FLAO|nr:MULTISPECIES: Crp/Fnr family transcriptional regulator [Xanthomarina]MCB0388832.1 Crp/Fnr family transcriptional regulator [Winogradskyella sp.]EMQ94026.1 transcriptional regulator, Crp/Fnr family [Xanthomarina gelatinilytica]MAL22027.1 Crp/Fnr family transcriptional regulator [Xanthomarina sp.]MBF62033.1 Crp/Fnr family transcriptional regulator [Xanthomarina sp.]MDX1318045.1 Crp/Fnr family transcriptional regulator [Xanthomarina gelatinilytica]|tara:strand:- start:87 stop:719 length:633 start_codon:yes stop_codon:yes gene_type:complete